MPPAIFLRALSVSWAVAICPLAALCLLSCVAFRGAMFSMAALLLGVAPALAWMAPARPWLRRSSFIVVGSWLVITVWLVLVSPDGRPHTGARVQNRYTGGAWNYQRHALGSLLPEIDQFMLGFTLVPAIDPLFTRKQARSVARLTRTVYGELEADPDFNALGSVMPGAYDEIWGRGFNHGHYFLYVPPRLDRKTPAPALVFLHGAGGNFKAYTWLLSRVADECGMVLIAPSCGVGNWDANHAAGIVKAALDDAAKALPLDLEQAHLAGLSNGALGVSRAAVSDWGDRFRSLIFLSPVCDQTALSSSVFKNHWRGKPVLIITGESDDRVPLSFVNGCAATMRTAGVEVDMSTYPGADHFLLFSHREQCLAELSRWLKQHSEKPTILEK